jgi:hypothetical protein
MFVCSGMRRLVVQYLGFGVGEMYRSLILRAQVKQLQKFVPSLHVRDVIRCDLMFFFNIKFKCSLRVVKYNSHRRMYFIFIQK